MASIYLRGRVWWVEFIDTHGKRQQRSLNTTDEATARQLKHRMSQAEDEYRDRGITFKGYATRWIRDRREMGLRDVDNEEQRLRDHAFDELGAMPLSEIRAADLRAWAINKRKEGELAPKTLRNVYGAITSLMRSAKIDGLVHEDPCVLTQRELGKLEDKDPTWRPTAIFNKPEIICLISEQCIPDDHRVVNALAAIGGLRQGEVAGLRWEDVERREPLSCIHVRRSYNGPTKSGRPRQVPVHPVLAKILAEWKLSGWPELMGRPAKDGDIIVPTGKTKKGRAGRMRTKSMLYKGWLKDVAALDIRHRRFHDLRRSFISLALADGARRDVLERVTHQALATRAIDMYTTLPWATLCQAVLDLDIQLQQQQPQLRLVANCDRNVALQRPYRGFEIVKFTSGNSGGAGSRSRVEEVQDGAESSTLAKAEEGYPINKGIDALWFDTEGCGPYPYFGEMGLRARMHSSYHPEYPVDDLTVKVMVEAKCFGGLFMSPDQARELAFQLRLEADRAEAEFKRLSALDAEAKEEADDGR